MTREQKLIGEWLFWSLLVTIMWLQTDSFSEPIAEFRFGADGWPKMVLLGIFVGATGQMALGLFEALRTQSQTKTDKAPPRQISRWQQIAIFALPLFYLWLMHRIGFFVATPIFIAAYLWVLEVRRLQPVLLVTAAVYGFVLLLFVRFFYVALPVGAWPYFYEINNQIITLVRLGL